MWTLHVMAGGSSNNKIATVTSTRKPEPVRSM